MAAGSRFSSSTSLSAQAGSTIGVFYTYVEADPNISRTTISYAYNDGTENSSPVTGCRSAYTQAILNNFPRWMKMRKEHDSIGHKLVQSWGCNLEHTYQRYLESRSDQYLTSADSYDDVGLAISDLSFNEQRVYEAEFRNLLFNSSFSMLGAKRLKKPEGWTTSKDSVNSIVFSDTDSLWGSYAVVLDGSQGAAEMKQQREVVIASGKLNASMYVKSSGVDSSVSTTERWSADTAGIIMVVRYTDDTVESYGVGFPKNTEDEWVRASFSVSLIKEMLNFEFITVNRSDTKYFVDLPQVEINDRASNWTHSRKDFPVYSAGSIRQVGGVQVLVRTETGQPVRKIELLPLDSEEEFTDIRIPTRIEAFSPDVDPKNAFTTSLGREINHFEEVMPTVYTAENDKILKKALKTPDRFGTHGLADLFMDEFGDLALDKTLVNSTNAKVKAVTAYKGWLYVVSKDTADDVTKYYLKIVKPDKVLYEDDFLQSYGDIELPLELGRTFGISSSEEEVLRVGICRSVPNAIFIDTNLDRRFYFKLKYDYF